MERGGPWDVALSKALAETGGLLEGEPYGDWRCGLGRPSN
jgi:hypothetical protein